MPRRLGLVVDNRDYRVGALRDLPVKVAASSALAQILADPAAGNFDHVGYLTNLDNEALREAIRGLFHFRKPYDLLLFYFAGYILLDDEGAFFLGSADADMDDPAGTAVPVEFLNHWMDRSFSRRQVLILDGQTLARGGSPGDRVDLAGAFRGKGYWRSVLSAGPRVSYVRRNGLWLGEANAGRLTQTVVHGLRSGAADVEGDGVISVAELYAYVRRHYRRRRWRPLPALWIYAERETFIIGRNPQGFESTRRLKWNLIFGAVMAPAATLVIGWSADRYSSAGLALTLLLMYLLLYRWLD